MILVDANLLVYAYNGNLPQHERGRAWLDEQLNGTAAVGLPWPSLLAFVRLVSNPRIFAQPVSVTTAWQQAEAWLRQEPVWIPLPTARHAEVLGPVMQLAEGRANLVPDAHLAALAIEHGLTLCSADRDFARFPGLVWHDPMAS